MRQEVIILNPDFSESQHTIQLLKSNGYYSNAVDNFEAFLKALGNPECIAGLIDIDCFKINNNQVQEIAEQHPNTVLFFTSTERIHPDLKESIAQFVFACMTKPLNPNELVFWLRSLMDR